MANKKMNINRSEYYKKYREQHKEQLNINKKLWARENRKKYMSKSRIVPVMYFNERMPLSYNEIVEKQNKIKIIRDNIGEIVKVKVI